MRTVLEKKSHKWKEHALRMMFPELAAWWARGDEEDTVGEESEQHATRTASQLTSTIVF